MSPVLWFKNSQQDQPDPWTHTSHHLCSSERPQPPRQLRVPQDHVQSRKLQLNWVPGGDGSSPVRYFTLQTQELPNGDWLTHSSAISHNYTSWEVNRWAPLPFINPHNPTNNSTRGFTQRLASNDPHRVDFTLRCFEATCVPCRAHEGRTIRAVWRECY